ncbi:hypothetical protein MRB53_039124 [Persea americana]|nr:hypothetical protein MRB53_039124 [Persea americana]
MFLERKLNKDSRVPANLWQDDSIPAPKLLDVLCQIAHFLDELGYDKAFTSLLDDAKDNNDLNIDIAEWQRGIDAESATNLLELYEQWYDENNNYPTLPDSDDEMEDEDEPSDSDSSESSEADGVIDDEAEETSDDGTGKESSSEDESSDSAPKPTAGKRKRSPPSSSDESSEQSSDSDADDSDSSSDEDVARPAKKAKVQTESSDSDSSDSSSSPDSESDDSSSESESSASEEESSSPSPPPKVEVKKSKSKAKGKGKSSVTTPVAAPKIRSGSQTSSTLDGDAVRSEPAEEEDLQLGLRIPTDQFVDPRFASNKYVPYDYAERAHRDLIVTKGKGFTKEKDKKKRDDLPTRVAITGDIRHRDYNKELPRPVSIQSSSTDCYLRLHKTIKRVLAGLNLLAWVFHGHARVTTCRRSTAALGETKHHVGGSGLAVINTSEPAPRRMQL